MEAIGIARAFAYGGSRGRRIYNPEEMMEAYKKDSYGGHSSVGHFYEKLFLLKDMKNTETAKKIAEKRDCYMRDFIDEFMLEWNGKN